MMLARVKNWADFQHYKDRSPPWIKLHKTILDDFDFACLHLASKALAPLIWLLASESADGSVNVDPDYLQFRLHIDKADIKAGLTPLFQKGFLIDASGVLAECLQDACLETEGETEKERDIVPQAARFEDFWKIYPIKRGKKPAEAKWKQKRLDTLADDLIADVTRRVRDDKQWRDGFAPHAATYLHQERWTDELAGRKPIEPPRHKPPTETPQRDPAKHARLNSIGLEHIGGLLKKIIPESA